MSTSVLITGGAGFLGRGIIRQIAQCKLDWKPTVLSRDESKHIRVRSRYPWVRIVRGDVTAPVEELVRIFAGHDIIIHAAANKLVDIGETAAWEVARNNVLGSMHVAEAAHRAGVSQCLFISSDKAVQPVNVYGMTKAVGERLWQEADGWGAGGATEFKAVRYGNVVGSTISIATYFQEQLARDGYLRVTNPAMTRYYFGVDDAIALIQYTLAVARRGSVVIPRIQALSVQDFACMTLGYEQGDSAVLQDPRLKVVGERPGEKLHESLLHEQESVRVLPADDAATPYWELRPPGEHHRGVSGRFSMTSDAPSGGWMPPERLHALVADALDV